MFTFFLQATLAYALEVPVYFIDLITVDALASRVRALNVNVDDPPTLLTEQMVMLSAGPLVSRFGAGYGYCGYETGFRKRAERVINGRQ
jgi:hypothetical protein